jgi:hypothetical protein
LKPYTQNPEAGRGYELGEDGFGWVYYRNRSSSSLEEELFFKTFTGLKLKKPHRGLQTKISVPPGGESIVMIKIDPALESQMSLAAKTLFTVARGASPNRSPPPNIYY